MKKVLWIAIAIVSANAYSASKAFNGQWVQIMRTQEPGETVFGEYYYDANSVDRNGEKVSFWERSVVANSKDQFTVLSVAHNVLNCDTQQSAQIAYVNAVGYGQVELPTPDKMIESPPVYKSFPPNSPEAKIIRFMCNHKR